MNEDTIYVVCQVDDDYNTYVELATHDLEEAKAAATVSFSAWVGGEVVGTWHDENWAQWRAPQVWTYRPEPDDD